MGNFDNLRLKSSIQSAEVLKTGLDYLRLHFIKKIDFFEKIFDKINLTNSNFIVIDGLTYEKLHLPTGISLKVSMSVNDLSVPVMLYNKFGQGIIAKGYGRLDFYGMFFRVFELGEFPGTALEWINRYLSGKTVEVPQVTRLDRCFDMFSTEKKKFPSYTDFFKKDSINKKTKIYEIGTGAEKESWSVGSKSAKRYVIRMYNKLLDISSKGKQRFYGDYLQFKTVHRFEVQFGAHFCKGFDIQTIDNLLFKANAFLGLTEKTFDGLMFYKYDNHHDINDFNKIFFTKTFVGKAKKFVNSGYNPYKIIYEYMINNCDKTTHYPMLYDLNSLIGKIPDLSNYL